MVGVNPEVAHEHMAGLNVFHVVAQALEAGKLFHIDLNDQKPGRFDQDFRFGSEGVRDAFYLVQLLEGTAWDGMRHFDAHAYRTESAEGVWDFARGCMRTYLILADKARRFDADPEIQEALATAKVAQLRERTLPGEVTPDAVAALRRDAGRLDVDALAAVGYGHEQLDQLVTELLLGVR
jgi:xylose isomerase